MTKAQCNTPYQVAKVTQSKNTLSLTNYVQSVLEIHYTFIYNDVYTYTVLIPHILYVNTK